MVPIYKISKEVVYRLIGASVGEARKRGGVLLNMDCCTCEKSMLVVLS
jgi:hypothetical protein